MQRPDTLSVGDTTTIILKYHPDDSDSGLPLSPPIWTSSDTSVVSVDNNGHIVAKNIGVANIRVTWGGFKTETVVYVNNVYPFKSQAFLDYCLSRYDNNNDGILQSIEVTDVVGLDLTELSIEIYPISLAGIESFSNLQKLKMTHLKITDIDLSSNLKLVDLDCALCEIESLDLRANKLLERVDCHGCQNLHTLIFGNIAEYEKNNLNTLNCYRCQIENLDLSRCQKLEYIDCRENNLSSLNLSYNPLLTQIWCSKNNIEYPILPSDFDLNQLKEHDF